MPTVKTTFGDVITQFLAGAAQGSAKAYRFNQEQNRLKKQQEDLNNYRQQQLDLQAENAEVGREERLFRSMMPLLNSPNATSGQLAAEVLSGIMGRKINWTKPEQVTSVRDQAYADYYKEKTRQLKNGQTGDAGLSKEAIKQKKAILGGQLKEVNARIKSLESTGGISFNPDGPIGQGGGEMLQPLLDLRRRLNSTQEPIELNEFNTFLEKGYVPKTEKAPVDQKFKDYLASMGLPIPGASGGPDKLVQPGDSASPQFIREMRNLGQADYGYRKPPTTQSNNTAAQVSALESLLTAQHGALQSDQVKKGDELDGYIYLGGDPSDPKSWRKK